MLLKLPWQSLRRRAKGGRYCPREYAPLNTGLVTLRDARRLGARLSCLTPQFGPGQHSSEPQVGQRYSLLSDNAIRSRQCVASSASGPRTPDPDHTTHRSAPRNLPSFGHRGSGFRIPSIGLINVGLLGQRARRRRLHSKVPSMDITVYGKPECPDWARSRAVLHSHGVDFYFHDILSDPDNADVAHKISGTQSSPVIVFNDQSFLVEPTDEELTDSLKNHGLI